jgi:Tol biopolymer transport system component
VNPLPTALIFTMLSLTARTLAQEGALERIASGLERIESLAATASHADRHSEPGYRALYTIHPGEPTAQFLFAAPGMISTATPEWSHCGKFLAFDAVEEIDHLRGSRIGVLAVEGPFKGKMTLLGYGNVPTWSPDDRQIAFLLNSGTPLQVQQGIWVMNADGTSRRWLCSGSYPHWSPDGETILFRNIDVSPENLGFFELKTGKIRYILGNDVAVAFGGATWAPDGKTIYFIAHVNGQQQVASIAPSGDRSTLRIFYTEPQDSQRTLVGPPVISPDGKTLVFSIQDKHLHEHTERLWLNSFLYTLSTKEPGAPPQLLEEHKIGVINRGMKWSRDGKALAFSSER